MEDACAKWAVIPVAFQSHSSQESSLGLNGAAAIQRNSLMDNLNETIKYVIHYKVLRSSDLSGSTAIPQLGIAIAWYCGSYIRDRIYEPQY